MNQRYIVSFNKYVKSYINIFQEIEHFFTTTTTKQYHDNIDLIEKVFGCINQNDHITNPIKHTPFLTMEDFEGLTESDKEKLIDQCWVQNEWSIRYQSKVDDSVKKGMLSKLIQWTRWLGF